VFNETSYWTGLNDLGAIDPCTQYLPQIYAAADRYGIDRGIALAQIKQESGCRPGVCSGAGACGIAQFMPATAARFGLIDRTNVDQSLDAWGRYMKQLLSMFGGRYDLALAGYNAGENRTSLKAGKIPNIPETQNYVASIMKFLGIGGTGSGGSSGDSSSSSSDAPILPEVETVMMDTPFFSGIPTIALVGVAALIAAYFILK
jgi:hypothetical protein